MTTRQTSAVSDRSPARRTQKERREEAELRLIEASMTLIAERGLARLTLAEVGDAAGFSRGLAAHHFGTKAGLITAVAAETEQRVKDALFPRSRTKTGLEALLETIRAYFLIEDQRLVHILLEFQKSGSTLDSVYRPALVRFTKSIRAKLVQLIATGQTANDIRPDIDPETYAEFLAASLSGLMLQHLLIGETVAAERLVDTYITNIRRSLSRKD